MKTLHAATITALLLISGANAYAQTSAPGLTRAEVRAQLVQAEADGLVPLHKTDYPPSPTTIARNKQLYAIQHKHDDSNAMASASQTSTNVSTTAN
jgi:uncharacterized protein DUF4148